MNLHVEYKKRWGTIREERGELEIVSEPKLFVRLMMLMGLYSAAQKQRPRLRTVAEVFSWIASHHHKHRDYFTHLWLHEIRAR